MTSLLRIRLLGTFALTYDDTTISAFNSTRLQALLAYLVLNADAPQPRHHLAYLFWPESTESQARSNLRNLFFQMRQALPNADHFLRYDNQTVQWNSAAGYTVDVVTLQHLLAQVKDNPLDRNALVQVGELYRGELLPSCYDDWILEQRHQLQQAVLTALEQLVTLLENQRAYEEGTRFAQRLLDLDPLTETSYQRLMQLRSLKGDRSGALRVYHDCVKILRQELAVEPSPDTQQLYARILNKDMTAPVQGKSTPLAEVTQLVGRVAEWQTLQMVWQQVVQGYAQVVVLMGEAGIGKTRLAEELLAWARQQGVRTARARSHAAQGALAFAPVAELLRTDTLRTRLTKLDDIWLVEVARLLPELLSQRPDLPQPQPMTENWQRQRFFEALARAVMLDEQPLVLLFDDLQWCYQETLDWLHYLLNQSQQSPLLVVGTVRDDEVDTTHAYSTLQTALSRTGQLTKIKLSPLSQEETAALAEQISDMADKHIAELYRDTRGNPLFVVETLRAGGQEKRSAVDASTQTVLPPKVYAVIQSRLAQLSPEAQVTARLAAVIGRPFTHEVLLEASGQDEDTLVDSLDELWRRRIVVERGDAYDFSHDRIRDVAYADITQPRRRQLNRRIANALEKLFAVNVDSVVGELAFHYEHAGEVEKSVAYYHRAADVARGMGAYEKSELYAKQGLALLKTNAARVSMPQIELALHISLGTSLTALNGYADPRVERAFQQASELSEAFGEDARLFPVLHGLSIFYLARGNLSEAQQLSTRCLRLATKTQDRDLLIEAHLSSGLARYYQAEFVAAREHFEASLRYYDPTLHHSHHLLYTQDPGVASLGYLGLTLWFLGYPDQAMARIDAAQQLAQKIAHPYSSILALFCLSWIYQLRQDIVATARASQALKELCSQYHAQLWWLIGEMHEGWALVRLMQGEQHVIDQFHETLRMYTQTGTELAKPYLLGLLADMYMNTNQYQKGLDAIEEALAVARGNHDVGLEAEFYRIQGELLYRLGSDRAESAYMNAIRVAQQQQARVLELRALTTLSRLYAQQNQQNQTENMRQSLAECYAWFTEGFELSDLMVARSLLDEVASSDRNTSRSTALS